MNYELLKEEDWNQLEPIMEGNPLPTPGNALIAVARDDEGTIKGMLILQVQLHMEPLVLTEPHVNYKKLVEVLEGAFADKHLNYWAFAPNALIGRMAESAGMKQLPWFVYFKEV